MRQRQNNIAMARQRIVLLVAFLALSILLIPANVVAEIEAFVSIAPQAYLVRQIGGPLVDVEILVPSGQSPATYELTSQQLTRLARAKVLFTTGVAFERRLLEKITEGFENLMIIPTHEGIELRAIERHEDADHEHEGTLDPHIWLDPNLAALQARKIASALTNIEPSQANTFKSNLDQLLSQLDSVDSRIRSTLAPVRGRTLYVFHPAYGYFADAYGLKQVAIETGGKEPSARQLAALMDQARGDSVEVVFVQPQFSRRQAESVGEAIGARVETLDPLAEDYVNNLMDMAQKIATALGSHTK